MTKAMKSSILFGMVFCLLAITFALLYHFKIVNHLNLVLTSVYVCYFVGLGLIYSSIYNKRQLRIVSSWISGIFATFFIAGSTALLIYGLINGQIVF